MGRPREHDERTRASLLASAEELLAATGPEALSVRAIAESAGTTTRAVYSVFGSKAGLLDALAIELFELLTKAIDAVGRTDDAVDDLVRASVDGFRAVMLEHRALYGLVFHGVVPGPGPEVGAAGAAAFGRLESLVAGVLERSTSDEQTQRCAVAVHALTEGLAAVELRGGLGEAPREVWAHSVRVLVAGWISHD